MAPIEADPRGLWNLGIHPSLDPVLSPLIPLQLLGPADAAAMEALKPPMEPANPPCARTLHVWKEAQGIGYAADAACADRVLLQTNVCESGYMMSVRYFWRPMATPHWKGSASTQRPLWP
ncbi:hypothetical protein VaNZ11_013838 [Volvox africanus]|uniref:Uncharacterized protein n=1 Tax=Volvox africanus TaxID=51714 RepID=A0ABQ5SH20_9CHLO|nr:hypothetical protein VaNZ11_013838 [Volvox africanus]